MKFETSGDISAPTQYVCESITTGRAIERFEQQRGVVNQRSTPTALTGFGQCWSAAFKFRNTLWQAQVGVVGFNPPKTLAFKSVIRGLASEVMISFTALSNGQTRLTFDLDLLPKSLSARIFVQSLKVVRDKIDARFAAGVGAFVQDISDHFGRNRQP